MKRLALCAGLLSLTAGPASAAVISYPDLASWSAAAGPSTLVDLAPVLGGASFVSVPAGFTASGVAFADPNDVVLMALSPSFSGAAAAFPGGSVLGCPACGGAGIDVSLPPDTYALSLLAREWFGLPLTVQLEDGTTFTLSTTPEPVAFFGIRSSTPLGRIHVDASLYPMVGDVRYAGAGAALAEPIPEPGSLLLLASGLAGLAGWRRRRG